MSRSFYLPFKRWLDLVLSITGLILLLPIFFIISIWIKSESDGPILFKQKRVARSPKGVVNHFYIYKFRTMRTDTPDVPTHDLENPDKYLTKSGRILRKTSLDELPQLFNIIKGDMSVVGPRPGSWNQYELIELRDNNGSATIRPGLTGLAQIKGRDEITDIVKSQCDKEYFDNMSLTLDIKIFLGTIVSVMKSEGIVEGKEAFSPDEKTIVDDIGVSIIIPTFRQTVKLKEAILSVKSQTHPKIEVIIVDDNDDESISKNVYEITMCFPTLNIIYVKNNTNVGSSESRNVGVSFSNYDYITFLDDDDLYLSNKVRNQLLKMIDSKSLFSVCNITLVSKEGKKENRDRKFLTNHEDLLTKHLKYHLTGTSTFMYKKSLFNEIGGFPNRDLGDEYILMTETILRSNKFSHCNERLVEAYIDPNSGLSSAKNRILNENYMKIYKKQYYHCLNQADIKYINMRHSAVYALCYYRSKNYVKMIMMLMKSFLKSPVGFFTVLIGSNK